MKRRGDKDLTREELIAKLSATRRKLRRLTVELHMKQDETVQLHRENYALRQPHQQDQPDQQLHADFEDLPNGNLAVRFSRPISWLAVDEPSAHAFITQITKWLQKRHAKQLEHVVAQRLVTRRSHLRLVKEPDRDS